MDPVKNFAKCTVSTGYSEAPTTIVLSSGQGAKLPNPAADGAFNLVWFNATDYADPSDDPNVEIVRCTARSTDTLTVTRGQEGGASQTHNASGKIYKMMLALSKKWIDDLVTNFNTTGKIYVDPTGVFVERNAQVTIERNYADTPTDVFPTLYILSIGKGDNAHWYGNSAIYAQARDRDDVTGSNKGVLKGLDVCVYPRVARNNSPYDDVSCIQCVNIGLVKATEGIYIGHYSGFSTHEFEHGIGIDAYCDNGILLAGQFDYGMNLAPGTFAQAPILIPNNKAIKAKTTGGVDTALIKLGSDNNVAFGDTSTVTNYVYNNLITGLSLYIGGDQGNGVAAMIGFTNVSTAFVDGTGSQAPKGVTGAGNPAFWGWAKEYVGTTVVYRPLYSAIQ
jgi:hypothetical protein